jgi:hypothetical protein
MTQSGAPCTKLAWQSCCYVTDDRKRKLPNSDRSYKNEQGWEQGLARRAQTLQE